MKRNFLLAFLAAIAVSVGCVHESFRDSTGRLYQLVVVEPDSDFNGSVPIRLVFGDELLHYHYRHRTVYSMVPIWQRVFSTDEHIEETLTIIKTEFRRTKETLAYSIVAEFRCGGEKYPITGLNQRKRATFAYSEMTRELVQKSVEMIAEKALAQLEECKGTTLDEDVSTKVSRSSTGAEPARTDIG